MIDYTKVPPSKVRQVAYEEGYNKGRAEVVEYLVLNGYIRYGFETEYLLEQMGKKEQKNEQTRTNG